MAQIQVILLETISFPFILKATICREVSETKGISVSVPSFAESNMILPHILDHIAFFAKSVFDVIIISKNDYMTLCYLCLAQSHFNHVTLRFFHHGDIFVMQELFLKTFLVRNTCTQLLLSPTLNVAFRSFEPRIGEPFPNEKLFAQ